MKLISLAIVHELSYNFAVVIHSSFKKFPGIRWYNLQKLLHEGNVCTLTFFVALWMPSEGNAPKNKESTVGFSYATMLQHTGRFWSRIS
jgi:hypothetical protein